jgi:hypothetical protein
MERNIRGSNTFLFNKLELCENKFSPCSYTLLKINEITSGRRVAQVRQQQSEILLDKIPGQMARNELNTRADTIYAGANFKCI